MTKSFTDCFFHSLDDQAQIQWQGQVIEQVSESIYLVVIFSWIDGNATCMRLVKLDDMLGWFFYPDQAAMIHAYDHGICRLGGKHRKQ